MKLTGKQQRQDPKQQVKNIEPQKVRIDFSFKREVFFIIAGALAGALVMAIPYTFLPVKLGNIFLDLSNYNRVLKCDKKVSNGIESPWYYMFKSLIRKEYNCFLDIEFIQKYVSLYGSILNSLNDSVVGVTGKEFTSRYARLLFNYDEFRYAKGEEFHLKLIHPGCCFTNNYVTKL